jgi:DNA helicase II / ATP-dependent DNA helicase PcrA
LTAIAALLAMPVTDAEIEAASASLRLPARAFHGPHGRDPRLDVLRANRSIDVAACPGSGKTTLLVAKLAILARRWTSPRQGVCVLSHTNVARLEIETRLGNDPAGRTVLSYPHFVGTIHGFVNQFITLPWLRSRGIDVVAIDKEICLRQRWYKIEHRYRKAVEQTGRNAELLRIVDADHNLGKVNWSGGELSKQSDLYKALVDACRATTSDGFFCHEDMMIWAGQALDQFPDLAETVKQRFPILFLDEVQDNSEVQSSMLRRIFGGGARGVVRQRFGDMNQAIYDRASDSSGANCDPFPDPAVTISVPNSHRFGGQIAALADPLALTPPGLVGLREHPEEDDGKQAALLLVDAVRATSVLPAFAELLLSRFSAAERSSGVFAAIGAVHRDTGRDDPPNCVAHYWPAYDPQAARAEGKPNKLLGYLRRGTNNANSSGDVRPIVENTADGLIRLASLLNPTMRHPNLASRHRQVLNLLVTDRVATKRYQDLCWLLVTGKLAASAAKWARWKQPLLDIAGALAGGGATGGIDGFLDWEEEHGLEGARVRHGNIFTYPATNPVVHVKIGSIHSVKGETHLATLVLDTHYRGSHLLRIKDWLTVSKTGLAPSRTKGDLRTSLKQHCVAVTRPSHLLCVAMRRDLLTEAELSLMSARHWAVGEIVEDAIAWREWR